MVKHKVINARVTPAIHQFVMEQARRENRSVSTWVSMVFSKMMADQNGGSGKEKRGRPGR